VTSVHWVTKQLKLWLYHFKQCISLSREIQLQEFNIVINCIVLCMKNFMCNCKGCVLNGTSITVGDYALLSWCLIVSCLSPYFPWVIPQVFFESPKLLYTAISSIAFVLAGFPDCHNYENVLSRHTQCLNDLQLLAWELTSVMSFVSC
jgi:hypothetical protein